MRDDERAELEKFLANDPELQSLLDQEVEKTRQAKYAELHMSQAKSILQPLNAIPSLEVYRASELKNMDLKPPEFAIDGLLPAGLAILAAPPKTGKSWLCLDLACSVASGGLFWGHRTQQGSVLYLDLEGRPYRVKDRFQKMRIDPPEALSIVHDANRIDAGLLDQLREWIQNADRPRLIIIDTFGRINGAGKRGENAYAADTRHLGPLQKLATENALCVLLVTHLRKSGNASSDDPFERITGSNGQFGVADTAWLIGGKRQEGEKLLTITSRDFESGEHTITFNKDLYRWQMLGDTIALIEQRELDAYKTNALVATVREMVQAQGGKLVIAAGDLIAETAKRHKEAPAVTPNSMRRELRKLSCFMLKYDDIVYREPSASGRKHTFELRNRSLLA